MPGTQDVLQPNPGGDHYGLRGGGDERGVWGGKDAQYIGYEDDPNNPGWVNPVFSKSGRQEDVERYQGMGEQAGNRPAYQLNYGAANQSLGQAAGAYNDAQTQIMGGAHARGDQRDVYALQYGAAQGNAPSRAELLGRGLIDQGLKSQLAASSSVGGGPLAQAAARRQAQLGAAQFQQQGMNQLSALRADEMERARAAAAATAAQIRGQDYQGAQASSNVAQGYAGIGGQQAQMEQSQGNLEMGQRQLNQSGQLGYEQLGWNTNNAALGAGLARSGMDQTNYWNDIAKQTADADRDQRSQAAFVSGGAALTGSLLDYSAKTGNQKPPPGQSTSDVRAKKPAPLLLDMGGRQPKAAAPNWLDQYMGQGDVKKAREEHDNRLEQLDAPNIVRDDPYAGPTPGGIQRQDPYVTVYNPRTGEQEQDSNAPVYFSDANAKREAFQQGVLYGEKDPNTPLPTYMQGRGPRESRETQAKDAPTPRTPRQVESEPQRPLIIERGPNREGLPAVKASSVGQMASNAIGSRLPAFVRERMPASFGSQPLPRVPRQVEATPPKTLEIGLDPESSATRAPGRTGLVTEPMTRLDKPPNYLPASPSSLSDERTKNAGQATLSQVQQDANRRLQGQPWTYKDEYRPSTDAPGQLHYGGMAQNYEQNPITATAVRRGDDGMRRVDMAAMQQVQGAGIASLQDQIDELKGGRRG